mmetsp:Transcript_28949/g.67193  ORF Transcript_28949/g.67193 Transcript_28949/m.67193 type:complete len:84 (-) Transcript_28949:180-431(-)
MFKAHLPFLKTFVAYSLYTIFRAVGLTLILSEYHGLADVVECPIFFANSLCEGKIDTADKALRRWVFLDKVGLENALDWATTV